MHKDYARHQHLAQASAGSVMGMTKLVTRKTTHTPANSSFMACANSCLACSLKMFLRQFKVVHFCQNNEGTQMTERSKCLNTGYATVYRRVVAHGLTLSGLYLSLGSVVWHGHRDDHIQCKKLGVKRALCSHVHLLPQPLMSHI